MIFQSAYHGRREQFDQVIPRNCPKKKKKKGEKSAIFYRDNARAMCCKIDTPEIGKGEMAKFPRRSRLYCFDIVL